MAEYRLNDDRFFDPDKNVREIARTIYSKTRELPIISPHGNVDPALFSENRAFPNPAELFIIPDHYVFRMLYSQGIPIENLGIPTVDNSETEQDPIKIWKIFCENYYLFNGTPSGVWLDYEFNKVLGVKEKPNRDNAEMIYHEISEKLTSDEFLPRNLFNKFNIELLSTTDAAEDNLEHHQKIIDSDWEGRVIPSFRPDGVTDIARPDWKSNLTKLGEIIGEEITSFGDLIRALESRRTFFKSMGAASTDHGVLSPFTIDLAYREADDIFQKALNGAAAPNDAKLLTGKVLIEMARMSIDDGLVMQIHAGSHRNHNNVVFDRFGLDKGADIPQTTEYVNNLKSLLNKYGNSRDLTLILFTLDESNYARELAPLAGHYPSLRLGPPWWFHDSIEGMIRYRSMVTETAGFYNTVGFNDDTRAFISIPARHDLSRRVDANYLAGLVAKHIITEEEGLKIGEELAYNLVKTTYKL